MEQLKARLMGLVADLEVQQHSIIMQRLNFEPLTNDNIRNEKTSC